VSVTDAAPLVPPPAAPPPAFRIEGDRALLFGALAKARAAFKPLENNRTVDVEKDGRKLYGFDYADLATVQDATTAALSANGLVITQPWWSDGDGYVALTMLAHASGAYMSSETWFSRPPDWQKLGSALSYIQRYQWRSILGISAPRDDDDGKTASDGNGAPARPPARAATRQPPAPKPAAERPRGSATDAQLHDIREVAGELRWGKASGEAFMKQALGYVAELEALSEGDAKKLLAAMVEAQAAGAPS
jgi:hypothetical protein